MILRYIYSQILVDLDEAHDRLARATGSPKAPEFVRIPEADIIKHVWWPTWLVKRAKNYERRKKKL